MKDLLFNNIGLKLMALFLGIASWFAIREAISFEIAIPEIPLEINTPAGWAILRQSETTVRVTFRGSQEDIRLMDSRQIRAIITPHTNLFPQCLDMELSPRDIKGIRGVRVVRVAPNRVQVSLDRESEKKVPVKSRTTGKPFAGEVEALVCDPAIVTLKGPAQQLNQTEWVFTEPVDVDGRIASFSRRCRVLPPDDTWTPKIEPAEVQVKIAITEKTETASFKTVPVWAVIKPGNPHIVQVQPERVKVELIGPAKQLEEIKNTSPHVFVDCVDLNTSLSYDLPVQVYLPPGKHLASTVDPPFVHVVFSSSKPVTEP